MAQVALAKASVGGRVRHAALRRPMARGTHIPATATPPKRAQRQGRVGSTVYRLLKSTARKQLGWSVRRGGPADTITVEDRDRLVRRLTDALVLSFYASRTQSLFALDCFVHTIATLCQQGCTITELQVLLTVKPIERGATILSDAEQDVLLSWSVLVMLTLHEMEALNGTKMTLEERIGRKALGMRTFVEQVVAMFRSGTNIDTLLEMQEEATAREEMTASIQLMQRSSLLVVLTATLAQGIREDEPDRSDASRFVASFDGGHDCHGIALKSLIAFMGGTVGRVFCTDRFVVSVMEGYRQGLTAKDLVDSISEEEYEQACKLLPVLNADTPGVAAGISRQLFGRWVSIVYMTLAQSGLGHPLASVETGWAWASEIEEDSQMFEMTNLSNFVTNSLRKVMRENDDASTSSPDLSERLKDMPDILEQLPKYKEEAERKEVEQYGTSWVTVEDEDMRQTSPTVLAFWLMIFLVEMTYRRFMASREQQQRD